MNILLIVKINIHDIVINSKNGLYRIVPMLNDYNLEIKGYISIKKI